MKVSVIIPAFNAAATIAHAIDSVFEQEFAELELIVVDDGSTDSTPAVLKRYASRISIRRQDNRGPAAARNAGIFASTGELIAFLDADDSWLPGKLRRAVEALQHNPAAVLVYSDAIPVGAAGEKLRDYYTPPELAHAPTMEEMLARWWPILPSTVVIKRQTLLSAGGFCEDFRSAAYEDPFLWIVAREHGEFIYIGEALVLYHMPSAEERAVKYERGYEPFRRAVSQRYGNSARRLLRSSRRAQASAFGYRGLLALNRRDGAGARRNFIRALKYEPLSVRTMLRLLRTFFPARLARALTGRSRRTGPISN